MVTYIFLTSSFPVFIMSYKSHIINTEICAKACGLSNVMQNLPAGVSKHDKAINAITVFVDTCQVKYKAQIIPGNLFIEGSRISVF